MPASAPSPASSPGTPPGPPAGPSRVLAPPPPPPPSSLSSELRSRGYRLTPQRQLVLEAVAALGHATPDDVLAHVRRTANGINISTVYRTLDLLEELGLVTHAHLGHGAPSYHPAHEGDHVHLTCQDCGRVDEVSPAVVAGAVESLARERGFTADVSHFAIFGRCADCTAAGESAGAAGR